MVKWILVMKIQPSICLDVWRKPRKKNSSQVGRHRDLNPGPPECESRALLRRHLAGYDEFSLILCRILFFFFFFFAYLLSPNLGLTPQGLTN